MLSESDFDLSCNQRLASCTEEVHLCVARSPRTGGWITSWRHQRRRAGQGGLTDVGFAVDRGSPGTAMTQGVPERFSVVGDNRTMKFTCKVCGKRAKRHCPAVQAHICARCCGSKRGTDFTCPVDCEFYPFGIAGYDLWLNLNDALALKIAKRVISEVGELHFKSVLNSFPAAGASYREDQGEAAYLTVLHCLLVERDSDGKTLADRWEADGWAGLRPDEALMMKYQSGALVTITEIQKVVDHQRTECIDIFDTKKTPFILVDRSIARRVTRFSRILGWLTHYPHFSKLGQFCHEVPQLVYQEFLDLIREHSAEEGYPRDEGGFKAYMMEHLSGLLEFLAVMPQEKMRAIFKRMDSYHCVGTYDITGRREEIRRILEAKPDFEWDDREPDEGDSPDVEYYDWQRLGESQEIEKEMAAPFRNQPGSELIGGVGNIKLYEDKLVFEAFTRQLYDFGKEMIKRHFGKQVKLVDEEISEIAGKIADMYEDEDYPQERKPRDLSSEAIPPEVRAELSKKFYEEHYARFLDDHIPALDGMTPREASGRPDARSMLVELMKEHIHGIDRMNREEGTDISIDFVLKELGLDELLG